MTPFRRANGQATVLTILFLTALLGMAAAVLDVGAWFHAKRQLQAEVDASALAGAQALPDDTGQASALAVGYANKNGGGISSNNVTFSTTVVTNDTISVTGSKPVPGIFSRVFGIGSVTVGASAKARTSPLSQARYVAPIVVNWKHSMLQCSPPPCSGATEIDLMDLHQSGSGNASGAFGLINLNQNDPNGNIGAGTLADWMQNGDSATLGLGKYYQAPSSNFNNSQFLSALSSRLNTEVLFPIYKTITGSGQNAQYDIIGWVGFVPTSFNANGSSGAVYGHFSRVIWSGLPSTQSNQQAFGAYAVQLIG